MPAKLFFYYSAMNAGKSALLLQSNFNYKERGMETLLFIPKLVGKGRISSRIGISEPATEFDTDFDFVAYISEHQEKAAAAAAAAGEGQKPSCQECSCVLIDEAQFLAKAQVRQLTRVADELQIPVLCYGLRTDFQGEPFEGSQYLLTWADSLQEVKTICSCGRKACMNQRVTADGEAVVQGAQVEVGGNDRYVGKCRRHFWESITAAEARVAAKALPPACSQKEFSTPEKVQKSPSTQAPAAVEKGYSSGEPPQAQPASLCRTPPAA